MFVGAATHIFNLGKMAVAIKVSKTFNLE